MHGYVGMREGCPVGQDKASGVESLTEMSHNCVRGQ